MESKILEIPRFKNLRRSSKKKKPKEIESKILEIPRFKNPRKKGGGRKKRSFKKIQRK